jgi:hypothetical protein
MRIKAQRSLETTLSAPQALFYNFDRTWMWQGPVPGKWQPLFDENGPRFFAGVEWNDPRKAPKFRTLLPEQGW